MLPDLARAEKLPSVAGSGISKQTSTCYAVANRRGNFGVMSLAVVQQLPGQCTPPRGNLFSNVLQVMLKPSCGGAGDVGMSSRGWWLGGFAGMPISISARCAPHGDGLAPRVTAVETAYPT